MADISKASREELKAYIARIERLEEERKQIADDIRDIYGEAKCKGYIPKIMRKIVALRKRDEHERQEEEAIMETYMISLGMQPDLFDRDAA